MSNNENTQILEQYQDLLDEVSDYEIALNVASKELDNAIKSRYSAQVNYDNEKYKLDKFKAEYKDLLDMELSNEANSIAKTIN